VSPYYKIKRQSHSRRDGKKKMGWGKSALVILGIAALFLGFAGLMTLGVPTYAMLLRRGEAGVNARIEPRLLWWIPFRVQSVERVTAVKSVTEQAPSQEAPRDADHDSLPRRVTPEAIGSLVLVHAGGKTCLKVSPVNLSDVEREVADFLRGGPAELRLRLVANWKFGVIVPGILAGFGGLIAALFLGESLWQICVRRKGEG